MRFTSPVLVGREGELRTLLEAAASPPSVVLVEGEAGVGKTRLVDELLAQPELERHHRLVGRCHQLGEPFPLGPVLEALRETAPDPEELSPVAGALAPLLPELSARLPAPPKPLGDRRAERHRLFRAVRELLGALGPTVLVLEDLHWTEPGTLELLRFLVPQLPSELTLLGTYRVEDLDDPSSLLALIGRLPSHVGSVQVTLDLLDHEQVSELVEQILEAEGISDEFADYVFESSEGLPFAVEETLRLLEDREDLVHRSGLWVRRALEEMGVPTAFRSSILERFSRLRPDAQRVAQAAAVLATGVRDNIVAAVAGLPDDQAAPALSEALLSGLLVEESEGRYGFRHVLARHAVEDSIPSPMRRRLHREAARVLEDVRPRPLAQLAHHYRAAGETKQWIRYAEAAADRAMSLQDDAAAYRFLKEGVSVPGLPAATRGRLAVKFATHALHSMEHEEAIGIVRELLDDKSLTPGLSGELRLCLGRLLGQAGETDERYAEIVRALEDLQQRPALAARAMADLSLPWVAAGGIEEHLTWADHAVRLSTDSEDVVAEMAARTGRAVTLISFGDPGWCVAIEEIPQPGPDAEEMKQAVRSLNNLSDALLHTGHYGKADELVSEGLRMSSETGYVRGGAPLWMNRLQLDWAVGAWEGLEERAQLAMETWEEWAIVRADAAAVLGLVSLAKGDVRAATELIEPLARDFPGEFPDRLWVIGGLARIRLAEGKFDEAIGEAAMGLERVEQKGLWPWATELAPVTIEALVGVDRRDEAGRLVRRFAHGLKGQDAPAASASLAVCRGLIAEANGQADRAARTYMAAEQAWCALPRPYEAARAREGAARCLLTTRTEQGLALMAEAMDSFRELGAVWDTARIRRTLRAHGAVPPNRRGRKGYGDELSPREAEVAGLAGEGLSNREIALTLFLSPKTVEHHLSTVMRKLGVTSRTEISERLEPPLSKRAAARTPPRPRGVTTSRRNR